VAIGDAWLELGENVCRCRCLTPDAEAATREASSLRRKTQRKPTKAARAACSGLILVDTHLG